MPYKIKKVGDKFDVVNTETGQCKNKKPYDTRAKAEAHMKALYAATSNESTNAFDSLVSRVLHEFTMTGVTTTAPLQTTPAPTSSVAAKPPASNAPQERNLDNDDDLAVHLQQHTNPQYQQYATPQGFQKLRANPTLKQQIVTKLKQEQATAKANPQSTLSTPINNSKPNAAITQPAPGATSGSPQLNAV